MKVDILFDIINKNKSKDDPIINLGLSISLSFTFRRNTFSRLLLIDQEMQKILTMTIIQSESLIG